MHPAIIGTVRSLIVNVHAMGQIPRSTERISSLIYVSMRYYVLTTSGDIVVRFHTAVCLSC